ncbi:MAG TPA: hypothetical protein VNS12_11690 [Pelagibacterium sp.]|uniref:hypothetical protein n=1 Tax=Pelagibacterium sp. TaxID=1967288 RepID=UPI002CB6D048|nr:hypothetical protein [Pelagibacterium sp.]HWJ88726.1 hypothetical protein [Pelagibacterium sp.]
MEKHIITWRGIQIEITFTPEKLGMIEHIELHAENRLALPVTETGYCSHFIPIGSVAQEGGPVAYVTAWLDFEAERTRWSGAQLTLF